MRGEFASIEDGFDKLPTLTGAGGYIVRVNVGGTALEGRDPSGFLTDLGGGAFGISLFQSSTQAAAKTLLGISNIVIARSSNTILGASNAGNTINATSTFTQTLTAAATLGNGWLCFYRNDGTGVITFDPNGTETINGATSLSIFPGESCVIVCDGSNFKTIGLSTGPIKISEATASSSATLDFIGLAGFRKIILTLEQLRPATDNTIMQLRISEDNGSTFKSGASDYAYSASLISGGAEVINSSAAANTIQMTTNTGNNSSAGVSGEIILINPASTTKRKSPSFELSYLANDGNLKTADGNGFYGADAAAFNAMRLFMNSGALADGSVTVTGWRA